MYCSLCGKENGNDNSFCSNCGAALSRKEDVKPKRVQMGELRFKAKKQSGTLLNTTYYVYVDDKEYTYSSSDEKELVVKVTPKKHVVIASLYRLKANDRLSVLSNFAGDVTTASSLNANKSVGAGMLSILGFSVWLTSKMTSSAMKRSIASISVDMSTQESIKLLLKANSLNKVEIEKE